MAAVVTFDAEKFKTMYPRFKNMADETLELYFQIACQICDNTETSIVKDLKERELLLYVLTCHIATLQARGSDIVGPLTSASEGGVSASFGALNNQNWYNQTQCGAIYWQMTAKYRMGPRYYAGCRC